MDEYINILCRRLRMVCFVSGEPNLKVDALHRLTCALGSHPSLDAEVLLKVCDLMRVFIMDWDRTVRACAFRCLRYAIYSDPRLVEEKLVKSGCHDLIVVRLEACKSSTERAAILKLIGLWIEIGGSEIAIQRYLSSIVELLLAMSSAPQGNAQVDLTSVLFGLASEAAFRFPSTCFRIIQRALEGIVPALRDVERLSLISVVKFLSLHVQVMSLPASLLTAEVFADLVGSEVGIAILSRSLELSQLSSDDFLDIVIARAPLSPLLEDLLLPFKEELMEVLISTNRFRYLALLKPVDTSSVDWKYPEWIKDRIEASTSGSTSRRGLSRRSSEAVSLAPTVHVLSGDATTSNQRLEEMMRLLESKESDSLKWKMLVETLQDSKNPILTEFAVTEISRLAIQADTNRSSYDVAAIAKLPSIQSDLLWLLAIKNDEARTAQAIQSGWLDDRWDHHWSRDIFQLPMACNVLVPSGGIPHSGTWNINGLELRATIIRRPDPGIKDCQNLTRELQLVSTVNTKYWAALLDEPLIVNSGIFKVSFDARDKAEIDVTDPTIVGILEKNHYASHGTKLTEITVDSISLIFEVPDSGFGLIAVLKPAQSAPALPSMSEWERSAHFLACIASTSEGVSWLRSRKLDELKNSACMANSDTDALWFVSGLLFPTTEASSVLASEIRISDLIQRILTVRPLICSHQHFFAAVRIASLAGLPLPPLGHLTGSRTPFTAPKLPKLPDMNFSTVHSEAFTDAHIDILSDLDSLASSVHFKQRSAALASKKQKHGGLFLSVPLWFAVMSRMNIGRYSLQVRRVIHSLFLHILCDERSIEVYDSLLS